MENKKIALPYSIQQFYVDCNNKKFERTLSKNKKNLMIYVEQFGLHYSKKLKKMIMKK